MIISRSRDISIRIDYEQGGALFDFSCRAQEFSMEKATVVTISQYPRGLERLQYSWRKKGYIPWGLVILHKYLFYTAVLVFGIVVCNLYH